MGTAHLLLHPQVRRAQHTVHSETKYIELAVVNDHQLVGMWGRGMAVGQSPTLCSPKFLQLRRSVVLTSNFAKSVVNLADMVSVGPSLGWGLWVSLWGGDCGSIYEVLSTVLSVVLLPWRVVPHGHPHCALCPIVPHGTLSPSLSSWQTVPHCHPHCRLCPIVSRHVPLPSPWHLVLHCHPYGMVYLLPSPWRIVPHCAP